MADAPRPLISAEVDLRDFHFMPLDIIKLMNSETWMMACTVPFAAAACMNLWCRSWHQVPAGSLPDNEAMHRICVAVPNWDDVRDIALRNFVKCSDGRLYHPIIVEAAKKAWKEKNRYRDAAKSRWKNKKRGNASQQQRTTKKPCVASKMDDANPHASHMQETGIGIVKEATPLPPNGSDPEPTPAAAEEVDWVLMNAVRERVCELAGADDTKSPVWAQSVWAKHWVVDCGYDLEADIYPAIEAVMAKRDGPPNLPAYFKPAIEERYDKRRAETAREDLAIASMDGGRRQRIDRCRDVAMGRPWRSGWDDVPEDPAEAAALLERLTGTETVEERR